MVFLLFPASESELLEEECMDFVIQQLVAQLLLTIEDSAFMTMGPCLRTEEPNLGISSKRGNPPE